MSSMVFYRLLMRVCILMAAISTSSVVSMPVLYPKWKPLALKNDLGADVLRDSDEEFLVWVKPPQLGSVDLGENAVSDHPNHSLCSDHAKNLVKMFELRKEFGADLRRIIGLGRKIDAYANDLIAASKEMAVFADGYRDPLIAFEGVALAEDLAESQVKLVDIVHRVDACRKNCKTLFEANEIAEAKIKNNQAQLAKFSEHDPDLYACLNKYSNERRKTAMNLYGARKSKELARDHLFGAERRMFQSFSKTAVLRGGVQKVNYRIKWADLIAKLSADNPKIVFKPIPIRSMRLNSNHVPAKVDDFYLSSLPIFRGFENSTIPLSRTGRIDTQGVFKSELFDSLSADFTFTLNGVCPLINPSVGKIIEDKVLVDESLKPLYAATLTYSYPVKLTHSVKTRFNPFLVYQSLLEGVNGSSLVTVRFMQKLLDEESFSNAVLFEGKADGHSKRLIVAEAVHRVLAGMARPLSKLGPVHGTRNQNQAVSSSCIAYSCKIAGWELFKGEDHHVYLQRLRNKHNNWVEMAGQDGELALTDIARFYPDGAM